MAPRAVNSAGRCTARGDRPPGVARWAVSAARTSAALAALLLAGPGATPALATPGDDLLRLLERRSCPGCQLQDADLVHADLRFTSLQGASLRGADLRGAQLEGTDLRHSDLSAALLDPGALARSHWDQAIGIAPGQFGYADLHNAAVRAANAGRFPEAEGLFGEALLLQPEAAVSWVGRGISRSEQGKLELAAQDLNRAAVLLEQGGEQTEARELRQVAATLAKPEARPRGGNGLGGQLLNGAAAMATTLAPLALKFLVPLAF